MSLFSAVQGSANALRVNQLGLQVVGNNIANVNTPGYIRQELILAPAFGYKSGDLIFGQGVDAVGVQQKLDTFVLDRLRQTQSQLSFQEQLEGTNRKIESLLNELSDTDFSSNLSRFANSFQDIANQPGSDSVRVLAIQRGQELATQLRSLSGSLSDIALQNRVEIGQASGEINRIVSQIAKLNQRVVEIEGGSLSNSDAVGLRDERLKALDELSSWIDITVSEEPTGAVTVFVGGDYLVANNIPREVTATLTQEGDESFLEIRFTDTDGAIEVSGGKVKGLYETALTSTSGGFQNKLDALAKDIIRSVNHIHSQGQGTQGFSSVLSDTIIEHSSIPLEQSNPELEFDNGSFVIHVQDARTGKTKTNDIFIQQQGLSSDTSLQQLATAINNVDGISAVVTNAGRLEIKADSEAIRFSFASDTSGILSAMGINTFFNGDSAANIAVRADLIENPSHLAISNKGIGNGADNAILMAEVFTRSNELLGGRSINGLYDELISDTTREINSQRSVTDGLRNFQQTLEAQHLGISGVNLDEEAVKMLLYQRAFQASSKLIATAAEMLDTLVNLI
ncbi:MAG: flagellar hook-associated protein FlgK [Pirellula sp.]